MRYDKLLKSAKKNCRHTEAERLESAWEQLNSECDKYSYYTHHAPNITLLHDIARHCDKRIVEMARRYRLSSPLETGSIIALHKVELVGVLDEIIKEKARPYTAQTVKKTHLPKMYAAYAELSKFLHNVLEPLAAGEPCKVMVDETHVWLEHEAPFLERDANIEIKLNIERFFTDECGEEQAVNIVGERLKYLPSSNIERFLIAKQESLELRAPWVFLESDGLRDYAGNNFALATILTKLDAYYSYQFCNRFAELCSSTPDLKNLYEEIWCVYTKDRQPELKSYPNSIIKSGSRQPVEAGNIWGKMPLCIRSKEQLYTDDYFKLGERLAALDNLIIDMDNLDIDERNFFCTTRPIFKTKESGTEQYIIIPWLLNNLDYEKTVYAHTLQNAGEKKEEKLRGLISEQMEKHVTSLFSELGGVTSINAQSFHISPNDVLDFDGLVIEQSSKCALLIEYKHSMQFRRTVGDRSKLLHNQLEKAATQLQKRLEYLTKYPCEIEKKLGLQHGILSELKVLPLIVSNSMEHDRRQFSFTAPVENNGVTFDGALKISLFELTLARNHAQQHDGLPLEDIINCIEKDAVWTGMYESYGYSAKNFHEGLPPSKVQYAFSKPHKNRH